MIKIYDVQQDLFREATQNDVDRLWHIAQAYGRMKKSIDDLAASGKGEFYAINQIEIEESL
jgi:hypothetical protein